MCCCVQIRCSPLCSFIELVRQKYFHNGTLSTYT
jgi:hypothetical protein